MGSSLDPALANIIICIFESRWLRDCSVFYRRCVDDVFALFCSPDHAYKLQEYLSSKYPNMNFSIEKEKDYCLTFVDVKIFRENKKFATSTYRRRPLLRFILTSKVLYLKYIKLI